MDGCVLVYTVLELLEYFVLFCIFNIFLRNEGLSWMVRNGFNSVCDLQIKLNGDLFRVFSFLWNVRRGGERSVWLIPRLPL